MMAITNKKRLDLIEAFLRENKYADLHTLAGRFGSSLSTIRRALNDLEAKGVVRRHHGGASIVQAPLTGTYDFITQDDTNAEEKAAIAEVVAAGVQDGMTLMIDSGTTTYAVAKRLLHRRLIIITNSLPIAALLNEVSSSETLVTGGTLYNRLGVLCGPNCEAALESMHADMAIMGCAGVTSEGIWNSNPLLSAYQRKMIKASGRVLFVADKTKLGKRSLVLTTPFHGELTVVTNGDERARAFAAGLTPAGLQWQFANVPEAAVSGESVQGER